MKSTRWNADRRRSLTRIHTPSAPDRTFSDVQIWHRLHSTQKPVDVLRPIIRAFCPDDGLVRDPFCSSGSSMMATGAEGHTFLGIELAVRYNRAARHQLGEG